MFLPFLFVFLLFCNKTYCNNLSGSCWKNLTRRNFINKIGLSAISIVPISILSKCQKKSIRPNIILIMADDFGYECLSCNGSTSYQTPNLDKLAESGVRFTHCYSMPLCTPSRVQLMTGKYNFRNYTEFGNLYPEETTFAHLFKKAGYTTCVAGKWQLVGHYEGSNYKGTGTYPKEAGFDEYCLWQIDELGSRYWNPMINQNGNLVKNTENLYGPDVVCNYLLDFIDRNKSQPFLVYYPMILTHAPFNPTPDSGVSSNERNSTNKKYFSDMVIYLDKLMGKIVKKLDEQGLRESTLILFVGDNGTPRGIISQMGETSIKGGKGNTTNAGTHVPLIANWKDKILSGVVCDDLIDFTDFLPTLLETVKIESPTESIQDGRSFFTQLVGQKGKPREWIFCHYDPKWGKWELKRFVQDKRWKLYQDGNFFDLENDPLEENPIEPDQLSEEAKNIKIKFQVVLDKMN